MNEDHARRLEPIISELRLEHPEIDPRLVATLVVAAHHQMSETAPEERRAAMTKARAREALMGFSVRASPGSTDNAHPS